MLQSLGNLLNLLKNLWSYRLFRRTVLAIPLLVLFAAVALTFSVPANVPPDASGPLPTFDARDHASLCTDLNTVWGKDWPRTIYDLEKLRQQKGQCDGQDPALTLYPAYYNYGAMLENRGDIQGAISAFRKALEISPKGQEAAKALLKYGALTPTPLQTCPDQEVKAALTALPSYTVYGTGPFISIQGSGFMATDQPYKVRGINYYPARAPWQRFLLEADPAVMTTELDLLASTGINTLRIFLWYDALFTCPGNGAVPRPEGFARLDAVIRLATERNMRLIVTLHDLPDLLVHPLYDDAQVAPAQTAFIVQRYRNEPTILAWDIRNEGDIDSSRHEAAYPSVMAWLRRTSAAIRQLDTNHLITAGWNENSQSTDGAVDFISFHYWTSSQRLRSRIDGLRATTSKPILLEEVGYSTFGGNESNQAASLHDVLTTAEQQGLAGWLVWTAFDFSTDVTCMPPACPSTDNGEHHFGLWHKDYSPKPAVDVLRAFNSH